MAMSLSLAVSAGAAFTDQDAVNYDVAVDTMVELGVINGYTDGSFKPANTVTRAEAAKMIAYTVAGADEDTINYYAGATKFEDVTGSYAWASAAVNYCAGKDIIAGRSETVFDPGATVTGAELAKMILVALGYQPDTANKAEALVGANWQTNAISMALKLDLFDGLNKDFVATQAANREETAQIIFNALSAEIKEIAFVIDDYYVYEDTGVTLLADAFDAEANPVAGDFGRPATEYDFADPDIDTIEIPEYADFTFTGKMKDKEVFKAIGAEGEKDTDNANKYITMTTVYVDGVKQVTGEGEEAVADTIVVTNDGTNYVENFGWGTTVEVYETDNKNEFTMIVINEYVGEVTKVKAADEDAGTERTVTVAGMTFETEDFAKKDVVLYTKDAGEIASMKAATAVEGKITKVTNGDTYTMDGVNYKISEKASFADGKAPALDLSGSWYVDSMGNLIKDKDTDDDEIFYGYLLAYKANAGDPADLLGNNAQNAGEKFKFVDEKGEVVILDGAYETEDDGDIEKFVASGENAISGEDFTDAEFVLFSYELNSKGEISDVTLYDGEGTASIEKGTADFAVVAGEEESVNLFGTDKTLYFYVDNTDGEEEYAVYTGYASAPTKAGTVNGYDAESGKVAAIALEVEDIAGQSDDDYVYFAGSEKEVVTEGDDTVTTFTNVYINGVKGSIQFNTEYTDEQAEALVGELYTFTTSTKTGYATLEGSDLLGEGVEITEIASTYFKAGGTNYVDSDTVYYEIDEDGESMVKVEALEALSDNDVYKVFMLYIDNNSTTKDDAAGVVVFQVVYDFEEE